MNTTVVYYGRVLRAYGRVLRVQWRWIVWGVLIALLTTTMSLILWPPLYRSDATVFVRTPGDVSRVRDGGDSYAQARARTYAVLASSKSVSERIIADLGLDMKPETLAQRIDARNRGGTALMDVAVSAPSPGEAQHTATVLLSELAQTVRALEAVPGSLVPRAELVVIDPPRQAVRFVAWGVPLPFVLSGAILLGAVVGATGAVIRSIFASTTSEPATDTGPHTNPPSAGDRVTTGAGDDPTIPIGVLTPPERDLSTSAPGNDAGYRSTTSVADLIDRLRGEYPNVFVTAPQTLLNDGTAAAAEFADGVLLVASVGETRRRDLSRAAENLRASGVPLTGTVLIGKDSEGIGPSQRNDAARRADSDR